MNKTEHYNLNQWDPEDKVTRTDFNADNAKLDAALHELEQSKARFVLLLEVELTEKTTQWDIDVSSIDWGAWQYVYMDFDIVGSGHFLLLPNGSSASLYYSTGTSYYQNSLVSYLIFGNISSGFRIQFNTCKAPWRDVMVQTKNGWGYTGACQFQDLKSLKLEPLNGTTSYYMGPTGMIRFWGLA